LKSQVHVGGPKGQPTGPTPTPKPSPKTEARHVRFRIPPLLRAGKETDSAQCPSRPGRGALATRSESELAIGPRPVKRLEVRRRPTVESQGRPVCMPKKPRSPGPEARAPAWCGECGSRECRCAGGARRVLGATHSGRTDSLDGHSDTKNGYGRKPRTKPHSSRIASGGC